MCYHTKGTYFKTVLNGPTDELIGSMLVLVIDPRDEVLVESVNSMDEF